jgi:hypothetical protein
MVLSHSRLQLIEVPHIQGRRRLGIGQALRDRFLRPNCESVYINMAGIHGRQELYDESREVVSKLLAEGLGRSDLRETN